MRIIGFDSVGGKEEKALIRGPVREWENRSGVEQGGSWGGLPVDGSRG